MLDQKKSPGAILVTEVKDNVLSAIARYVYHAKIESALAFNTARLCLADALGCAILALQFPACKKLLGPVVDGTLVPNGSRVPGTKYSLDPILASFNLGAMIRWLDYNDTWLGVEWGHPSDNIGGIFSVADFLSRKNVAEKKPPVTVEKLLECIIKAYEIQGILALYNSFNKVGLDHVILVKVATTAVVTYLLGGSESQIADAVSNAWIDLGPLRTYRHAPNTGSRKSWAAGDATSRGVFLGMMTLRGEMGYPQTLTTKKWGFNDAIFHGTPLKIENLNSYVMENILFKVSFPAEFHAQTAVECAFKLHPLMIGKIEEIESIEIETQESAVRIIDKRGPLNNPADRDHCLQYMVAVALLKGSLCAFDYEEEVASDQRIDFLRDKINICENESFSKDYLDPEKRSIANSLTITFKDGTSLNKVIVEYPIGHKRRREEAIPLIFDKFENNLNTLFSKTKASELRRLFEDQDSLLKLPVHELANLFVFATH